MPVNNNKPWSYDVSMESCVGSVGSDLWFTTRSTGGDSSDSLIVAMPTDFASLIMIKRFVDIQFAELHNIPMPDLSAYQQS